MVVSSVPPHSDGETDHLTVMVRQRQQAIGARKAAVEEDWTRLCMG
jgi:hypothetical protein